MIATLNWHGERIHVDYSQGTSLAIPLDLKGPQPSFFTQSPATSRPLRAGDYVGDVREGGSCNADVIELVPHCHGTHTECIGHIRASREAVQETIYDQPGLALILSVPSATSDSLHPQVQKTDPGEGSGSIAGHRCTDLAKHSGQSQPCINRLCRGTRLPRAGR